MTDEIESKPEVRSPELSAHAVGRLMGLATGDDLRVLEGKIDLLTQKLASMAAKLEKMNQAVAKSPTGSDLERIDVQVGTIKALVREIVETSRGDKEQA